MHLEILQRGSEYPSPIEGGWTKTPGRLKAVRLCIGNSHAKGGGGKNQSLFHPNACSNFSKAGITPFSTASLWRHPWHFFSARKHIGKGDYRCAMRVSRGSHATPFDEEVYGL
jgi:hypothetical protein